MQFLIQKALQSRRVIFQGAIIATLIAFGVNLLSSWLAVYFKDYFNLTLLVGVLFIVIGFLYFIKQLLSERHQSLEIDSVIFLNSKDKSLARVDHYSFSEKLDETLSAAFVENEALKHSWEREMFPEMKEGHENEDPSGKDVKVDEKVSYFSIVKMTAVEEEQESNEKYKILIEAIEFCFLDYLSMHLSEYFEGNFSDDKEVSVLERNNIPHMLLANRILSLLSTPIEDRQIFVKSGIDKNPPKDGEIHAIYASNGAVYEKFQLHLPSKTSISRPLPGHICLDHPRFQMSLTVSYRGFGKNLPMYFSDLYVSDEINNLSARCVHVSISATLHPLAFIQLNGWEYYQWIDSFFEYMKNKSSFDEFLEEINWKSVSTAIRADVIKNRRKARFDREKAERVKVDTKPVDIDKCE